VLRLMSAVIHSPWERQDGNLFILPGTAPVDDPQAQAGLRRHLEDDRVPALEKGHRRLRLAAAGPGPRGAGALRTRDAPGLTGR
jgi:hypothetical protein